MLIKTVVEKNHATFDSVVNIHIKNGWTLKRRDVITVRDEPNEVGSCAAASAFYAELEKY